MTAASPSPRAINTTRLLYQCIEDGLGTYVCKAVNGEYKVTLTGRYGGTWHGYGMALCDALGAAVKDREAQLGRGTRQV